MLCASFLHSNGDNSITTQRVSGSVLLLHNQTRLVRKQNKGNATLAVLMSCCRWNGVCLRWHSFLWHGMIIFLAYFLLMLCFVLINHLISHSLAVHLVQQHCTVVAGNPGYHCNHSCHIYNGKHISGCVQGESSPFSLFILKTYL